jgi:hypothetical protein
LRCDCDVRRVGKKQINMFSSSDRDLPKKLGSRETSRRETRCRA